MKTGQTNAQFTYDGDIVLTCYAGEFQLEVAANAVTLVELDQVVIPHGSPVTLACVSSGTVQLIWAPPYAPAVQDRGA
jgi:quercetin dioxygenase-like cupin family protein